MRSIEQSTKAKVFADHGQCVSVFGANEFPEWAGPYTYSGSDFVIGNMARVLIVKSNS